MLETCRRPGISHEKILRSFSPHLCESTPIQPPGNPVLRDCALAHVVLGVSQKTGWPQQTAPASVGRLASATCAGASSAGSATWRSSTPRSGWTGLSLPFGVLPPLVPGSHQPKCLPPPTGPALPSWTVNSLSPSSRSKILTQRRKPRSTVTKPILLPEQLI